jgi:hypothetical protein
VIDYFSHLYGDLFYRTTRKLNIVDILTCTDILEEIPADNLSCGEHEVVCQYHDAHREVVAVNDHPGFCIYQRVPPSSEYKLITVVPRPTKQNNTMFMDSTHMYVIGGRTATSTLLTTSDCYNIPWNSEENEQKYVQIAPMKSSRHYHVGVLLKNRYYVFGGMRGHHFINNCEYLDLASQTWHSITPLPDTITLKLQCAFALNTTTIAVCGGSVEDMSTTCKVQLFDTMTDTWSSANWSLPFGNGCWPLSGFVVDYTLINGKRYLFAMQHSHSTSLALAEIQLTLSLRPVLPLPESPYRYGLWCKYNLNFLMTRL